MRVPVRLSDLPAAPRDSRTVAIYCRPHGAGTRPAPLQVFPAVAGGPSRAQRLLGCRPGMRLAAVVALSYLVLARVAAAGSRPCGDDVPCDCGDVLVSGRTLRDGFALRGLRYRVEGNRATENGRFGFSLAGRNAALGGTLGNEAAGNRRDGLLVRGRNHEVVRAVATANGRCGIRARLAGGSLEAAVATGNHGAGVHGRAHDATIADSVARGNGGAGIDVRGSRVRDGGGNRAARCRVGAACR